MIGQRASDAAPAVQASAEQLPFEDGSFDAAMAVLTAHHWHDLDAGLAEMRRVAQQAPGAGHLRPAAAARPLVRARLLPGDRRPARATGSPAPAWPPSCRRRAASRSRSRATAPTSSSPRSGRGRRWSSTPRWCGRCGSGTACRRRSARRAPRASPRTSSPAPGRAQRPPARARGARRRPAAGRLRAGRLAVRRCQNGADGGPDHPPRRRDRRPRAARPPRTPRSSGSRPRRRRPGPGSRTSTSESDSTSGSERRSRQPGRQRGARS